MCLLSNHFSTTMVSYPLYTHIYVVLPYKMKQTSLLQCHDSNHLVCKRTFDDNVLLSTLLLYCWTLTPIHIRYNGSFSFTSGRETFGSRSIVIICCCRSTIRTID